MSRDPQVPRWANLPRDAQKIIYLLCIDLAEAESLRGLSETLGLTSPEERNQLADLVLELIQEKREMISASVKSGRRYRMEEKAPCNGQHSTKTVRRAPGGGTRWRTAEQDQHQQEAAYARGAIRSGNDIDRFATLQSGHRSEAGYQTPDSHPDFAGARAKAKVDPRV